MKRGSGAGNPHKPVIQHWKFKAHQPQPRNAPTPPASNQVPAPVAQSEHQHPPQPPAPIARVAPPAPRGSETWSEHWQDAAPAGYYSPQQRPVTGFYPPEQGGYLSETKATSSPVMQATPRARGQRHQRRHSAPNVPLQSFVHHWKLDGKQSSSPRMRGPTYPPPPVQARRVGSGGPPSSPSVDGSQVLIGPAPVHTQPGPGTEPGPTRAPPPGGSDANIGSGVESGAAVPTGGRMIRTKTATVFHQYQPPEAKGDATKNRAMMSPRSHPYKDGRKEQMITGAGGKPWPKRGTSPLRTPASPQPETPRMRAISEQERYEYPSPHMGMMQGGYEHVQYPDAPSPSSRPHHMASPAPYHENYQNEPHALATPPPYAYATSTHTPYDLSAPAVVDSGAGSISEPRPQGYQTQTPWYQSPTTAPATTAHPYSPHPSEPPALHVPSPHHYASYPSGDPQLQAQYTYTQWPQETSVQPPPTAPSRNLAFQMLLDSVEHQLKLDEREEQEKQMAGQQSGQLGPMNVQESHDVATQITPHETSTVLQPSYARTVAVDVDTGADYERDETVVWQEPVRSVAGGDDRVIQEEEDSGSETVSE